MITIATTLTRITNDNDNNDNNSNRKRLKRRKSTCGWSWRPQLSSRAVLCAVLQAVFLVFFALLAFKQMKPY